MIIGLPTCSCYVVRKINYTQCFRSFPQIYAAVRIKRVCEVKGQQEEGLSLALYLVEQALELCDSLGFSFAAIHLCEASEYLKVLAKSPIGN